MQAGTYIRKEKQRMTYSKVDGLSYDGNDCIVGRLIILEEITIITKKQHCLDGT